MLSAKNWCFQTVALEKTFESPLNCKIKSVNPKGNQLWIFIGRTDAEAEAPILWSPDVKNWLTGKDPNAGKGWRQEKGLTEDEMVGWHHGFDGHECEQAPGIGDGQGRLVCCSPWSCKELDTTEQLNWTEQRKKHILKFTPTFWDVQSVSFMLSILKEISPGCSLEGLMLRLKLQYFGHLMQKTDSFEKPLMLGKTEGRRRSIQQRMRWLDGITNSTDVSLKFVIFYSFISGIKQISKEFYLT